MAVVWTVNGTDLSTYGLNVQSVQALDDIVPLARDDVWLPGRDTPVHALKQRQAPIPHIQGRVVAANQATLNSYLASLRSLLTPGTTQNPRPWLTMTRDDRASQALLVRTISMQVPRTTEDFVLQTSFDWFFSRMPYWTDATDQLSVVSANLCTTQEASLEDATTTGWGVRGTSTLTNTTTAAQFGTHALSMATSAASSGANLARRIAVVPGRTYTLSGYERYSAASAVQFQLGIEWYDVSGSLLSTTLEAAATLTTAYVRHTVFGAAPATAFTARPVIQSTSATAVTVFLDGVQFEDAASASAWAAPGTSTSWNINGDLEIYPVYYVGIGTAQAGGINFTVTPGNTQYGAAQTFSYTGALAAGDVLVITTDLPLVQKAGANAWAGTSLTASFPLLGVGSNAVSTSTADISVQAIYRQRYE